MKKKESFPIEKKKPEISLNDVQKDQRILLLQQIIEN